MSPQELLEQYWGYTSYRSGQKQIIEASISGRDVMAVLPTGGGKSLCYQIPGLMHQGITLVISPLVALMQDQVEQLKARGIKAVSLSGGLSFDAVDRILDNCIYGDYKFLYLSPERLQQDLVQSRIKQMQPALIAIDEAHCISHWGHDFRPAYAKLSVLRTLLPEATITALTATANKRVVEDIHELLQLKDPYIHLSSLSRDNLRYDVKQVSDKQNTLIKLLQKQSGSGIVYLRSRKGVENLAQNLEAAGIPALAYHGGLDSGVRKQRLQEWMQSDQLVMVATNAFGMGIDKADVRAVIHYQLSDSLESYYQEAGRAGRDRKEAQAVLLVGSDDLRQGHQMYVQQLPDLKFTTQVYISLQQHLRIAYGEGAFEAFPLDFANFCADYNLPFGKTYASFQMMDRLGILRLSPVFSKQTQFQFTAPNSALLDFFDKNPQSGVLGQLLLRSYPGIAEAPARIALKPLARQVNRSENFLIEQLEFMANQGVATLELRTSDANITFLTPREDARTLYPFGKEIEQYHNQKVEQFGALKKYITADSGCRQQLIASYFDQVLDKPCLNCDLCDSRSKATQKPPANKQILDLIENQALSRDELAERLNFAPQLIGALLQALLDDGLIELNTDQRFTKI
ncbi:RecQ family ATP-dependent DNA helicase [Gilvibacter sediminis]|uniref:RecQ family ATP-dependent DNA helicase n=1 Tax=Gilvibacter sediminis TaxID=379071 RepID=UPI002350E9D0|nr:RecQ family ATP-dependent DNA helicase [Gilvibacter sediminis]MDC7998179.1 RecQ family ATP-dependent DNA helicase [Gilvibacter sediminis]